MLTLIYFIFVLGITVLIHEFGHFIFAKRAGIYVYEFSIGMGPKLFSFNRKNDETMYSIRLFPIGGYVSMAGEEIDEDDEIPLEKRLYAKSWGHRFMTIVAGVLFNFLLAIVIFFGIALVYGATKNEVYVGSIEEGLPASNYLQVGDIITNINGKKVTSPDYFTLQLALVKPGEDLDLTVRHKNGEVSSYTIKPEKVKDEKTDTESYKYGFGITTEIEKGFIPALKYGFVKTYNLLEQMVMIIFYLFTGKLGLSSLSGPIGIFNVVGESAKAGFVNIIYLIGYLSVNVGFINILPIPAFDGGRLLFLVIEKIKGSPVNPKVENTIHGIGFALLMLLMLIVTWNDIIRFF